MLQTSEQPVDALREFRESVEKLDLRYKAERDRHPDGSEEWFLWNNRASALTPVFFTLKMMIAERLPEDAPGEGWQSLGEILRDIWSDIKRKRG